MATKSPGEPERLRPGARSKRSIGEPDFHARKGVLHRAPAAAVGTRRDKRLDFREQNGSRALGIPSRRWFPQASTRRATNEISDMTHSRTADERRRRLAEKISRCIRTGDITLSSGKKTNFYFDGRLVTLDPEGSVLVGGSVLGELERLGARAVGGLTSGADPITSATGVLAWQAGIPIELFFVRKQRKEHGTQRRIEGPPLSPEGRAKIALVDDVLTTGGSILEAREAILEEIGNAPRWAIVLVDREEGGRERLEEAGLEVLSVFRRSDFLGKQ